MLDCVTPWNVIWNLFNPHQCAEVYELTSLTEPFSFVEYLPYFLKTFILELPVYYLFLKKFKQLTAVLKINAIVNLATHPIVFFIIPLLLMQMQGNYFQYLVLAEIFAPLVEALILFGFFKLPAKRAFAAAIAANLFSWSLGVYWV